MLQNEGLEYVQLHIYVDIMLQHCIKGNKIETKKAIIATKLNNCKKYISRWDNFFCILKWHLFSK